MERLIDLSEREILALAIFSEEEDGKIYRGFAEGLREQYPGSAKVFDEMADEEVRHRTMLYHFRLINSERLDLATNGIRFGFGFVRAARRGRYTGRRFSGRALRWLRCAG